MSQYRQVIEKHVSERYKGRIDYGGGVLLCNLHFGGILDQYLFEKYTTDQFHFFLNYLHQ